MIQTDMVIMTKQDYVGLLNARPNQFLTQRVEELEAEVKKYKDFYKAQTTVVSTDKLAGLSELRRTVWEKFEVVRRDNPKFSLLQTYTEVSKSFHVSSREVGRVVREVKVIKGK